MRIVIYDDRLSPRSANLMKLIRFAGLSGQLVTGKYFVGRGDVELDADVVLADSSCSTLAQITDAYAHVGRSVGVIGPDGDTVSTPQGVTPIPATTEEVLAFFAQCAGAPLPPALPVEPVPTTPPGGDQSTAAEVPPPAGKGKNSATLSSEAEAKAAAARK